MKMLHNLCLAACLAASAQAQVQFQGTEEELAAKLASLPRLVSLNGTAEIRTNANRARIDLLVTTEKRSLDEALAENATKRGALAAALRERGFAADQIQNSDFASSQRTGIFTDKIRSYRIENHLIVTVRTPEQFREFARQADRHPDAVVQSIEFDHADEKALQRRAVEEALADAATQKAVFEKSLGVRLSPRGFSEGRGWPLPDDAAGQYPASATSGLRKGYGGSASPTDEAKPGFEFGELVFKVRVSVQYLVESGR